MKELLQRLIAGQDLSEALAGDLLRGLVDPDADPIVAGAVLATLHAKGETPGEVRGLALAMRELALRPAIPPDTRAVDIVGTGGDGSGSFNISTGAALLAAAAGAPVVKHGNRSVSSRSGSADVLEALGYTMPGDADAAVRSLVDCGFTFLFAPTFHPAMAAVAAVRRALGVRTVFNILGPLTNPAAPPFGVIGAFGTSVAALMADTLSGLPLERAFVVHGEPGWDEATPCGPFLLFDVRRGSVEQSERDPAELGLARCAPEDLAGGDAAHNARALRDAFEGEPGAHRDALVLGAALALEVAGHVATAEEGVACAAASIDDGSARGLLERLSAAGGS